MCTEHPFWYNFSYSACGTLFYSARDLYSSILDDVGKDLLEFNGKIKYFFNLELCIHIRIIMRA